MRLIPNHADAVLNTQKRVGLAGLRQSGATVKERTGCSRHRAQGFGLDQPIKILQEYRIHAPAVVSTRADTKKPDEAANPIRPIESVFRKSTQGLRATTQQQAATDQPEHGERRGDLGDCSEAAGTCPRRSVHSGDR